MFLKVWNGKNEIVYLRIVKIHEKSHKELLVTVEDEYKGKLKLYDYLFIFKDGCIIDDFLDAVIKKNSGLLDMVGTYYIKRASNNLGV